MKPGSRPLSLARTAAATYATNAAVVVLSMVNVLIVARALGPEGRGDVAFAIAVVIVTAHLATLSVQQANVNIAGSEPGLRSALATNSVLLSAVLGAVASACVLGLVTVVSGAGGNLDGPLLALTLSCVPIVVLRTLLSFILQAEYGFTATNLAWIAGPLLGVVVNAALALTGLISVDSAIGAWVGGQVLGTVVVLVHVQRRGGFGRPDAALARRCISFGLKSHVSRIMEVGNVRFDQWLIGALAGSRELGYYSIAASCAEVLFYLPGILVLVQRPDLVRAGRREAAERASRVLRSALLAATPAVALLIVFAPIVCVQIFGAEFDRAGEILRILALGAFGITALELLTNALTAQRAPLRASVGVGVAFALTVSIDVMLVPMHGGVGAAIGMLTAQTVGGLTAAILFTRAMNSSLRELMPRTGDLGWLLRKVRAVASRPAEQGAG